MHSYYQDFLVRDWQESDRLPAAAVIQQVLAEYGLGWQPEGADRDVVEVEKFYQQAGGQFWVVVQNTAQGTEIVGTAAYYPITRGTQAVEIRKMYLLPQVRGQGLGSYLLGQLEIAIAEAGWQQIYLETATVLQEAVRLYESHGYQATTGVETARCDRVYLKFLSL
jgi:putative acetyltransferase